MRALLLCVTLACACGASGSGVQVTVTSDGELRGVESLRATVTNAHVDAVPLEFTPPSAPVTIDAAHTQRFTLLFDATRSGEVDVALEALAGSRTIAMAVGKAVLAAGALVEITITLPGSAMPDAGADLLTIDQAQPDLAQPDLATPDLAQPDLATPDLATPDLVTPDLLTPDLITLDLLLPDLVTGDLPRMDLASHDLATPDLAHD